MGKEGLVMQVEWLQASWLDNPGSQTSSHEDKGKTFEMDPAEAQSYHNQSQHVRRS